MTTIHLVSHTHWDREWYLTFQQFRLKLVRLMDELLELLQRDRRYKHFMLDGQTIVLRDYLDMRPEAESQIRAGVQSGRLLIGPWYILPDMFLVGPEAHIRNLLEGERIARRFGRKMPVGYIPDPFGHPGQMPQILRGFGLETACLWRGLDDQPCELWWESPDGSRVLLAYLRDSYSNGANLPTEDGERFLAELQHRRDALLPHATSGHVLIMHGTDHMQPPADTASAIDYARRRLGKDTLLHSTLPAYLAAIQKEMAARQLDLPVVRGELRSCKRSHLLPGVLSTRVWIKQRNQACETLLERWAEPFSTWASLLPAKSSPRTATLLAEPAPLLRQAWRLLMECHPHDSICGCSIDQVHEEMRVRFDQVEQIGEEITRQSLETIAAQIDTRLAATQPDESSDPIALVVFNPTSGPRTDWVKLETQIPLEWRSFELVDESGQTLPCQTVGGHGRELLNAAMSRKTLSEALKMIHAGRAAGMVFRRLDFQQAGDVLHIEAILSDSGEPDAARWQQWMQTLDQFLAKPEIETIVVHARSAPATALIFAAPDVPGYGYRTFWLRCKAGSNATAPPKQVSGLVQALMPLASRAAPAIGRWLPRRWADKPPFVIENEFLRVEASPADGVLTITDRRNNAVYHRMNRFVDGGDCGDEYNYSPPERDMLVTPRLERVNLEPGDVQQSMEIHFRLEIPARLSADRKRRGHEKVALPLYSRVTLTRGVPRVDIHTEIENRACDHRLRVHFAAPFSVSEADFDGHFEVVRRPLALPAADETWAEQPRPEKPQRTFTAISNGAQGLLIANRGLPEVEVLTTSGGDSEIALTLLRCVGWLSRDDFATRRGHAGPMLATPGAQMPGPHAFDYAIIPYTSALPAEQAYAFAAPLRAVAAPLHDGYLPACSALISVHLSPTSHPQTDTSTPRFALSAIKTTEDGKGWIVRGYNLSGEPLEVTLIPWQPFRRVARVNLAEETQTALCPADDGRISINLRPHEIVTVRFEHKG